MRAAGSGIAIAPVIPASRDSLYAAVYGVSSDEKDEPLMKPSHIKINDFIRFLESLGSSRGVLITGNDLPEELCRSHGSLSPAANVARGILEASRESTQAGPAEVSAVYLRLPY